MPMVTQILCDGCQAVKKEANHWYSLTINEQSVCIRPLESAGEENPNPVATGSRQYCCGRACTLEALMNWMDTLSHKL